MQQNKGRTLGKKTRGCNREREKTGLHNEVRRDWGTKNQKNTAGGIGVVV